METIACLNCQSQNFDPFIEATDYEKPSDKKYSLQKCRDCGLIFENPRPTLEELPQYYSNENYYSYIELEKKKHQKIGLLERLRHFLFEKTIAYYYGNERSLLNAVFAWIGKGRFGSLPKSVSKGKILDIGCGDGVFLDVVRQHGWEPYGVEINEDAVKRANQTGLNVHAGDLLSASYAPNTFDVVRMWSVLEHTPNPNEVLARIREILKPGGILLLQVPNIDSKAFHLFGPYWSGLDLPRHLVHYTPETLRKSLLRSGFDSVTIQFASVGTTCASYKFKKTIRHGENASTVLDPLLRVGNVFFDRVCDWFKKGDCMYIWASKKN